MQFHTDLDPEQNWPRLRMDFDNGWTISLAFHMSAANRCDHAQASVAAFPTVNGRGRTQLLENEATADEAAKLIYQVQGLETAPMRQRTAIALIILLAVPMIIDMASGGALSLWIVEHFN